MVLYKIIKIITSKKTRIFFRVFQALILACSGRCHAVGQNGQEYRPDCGCSVSTLNHRNTPDTCNLIGGVMPVKPERKYVHG
ncbi:hypothetical protein M378DRAFT_167737 [Amanita muscaria Koide BX008]|uniref:Uncharacterized protein n=1 Tax=Amanita muscaria (strain Koide BX008) TaxID=946122 RepID=A0A0C2WVD2_AMAMK|nr:hypothetical protein M378DRAFT_167737 [Amanita muscaria Koide BX008]